MTVSVPISALIALGFGYLLGTVPFGLLLTRAAGLGDIRKVGSGNIGATNVLRTGHRVLAAATLLLDGGKGTAAVLLAEYLGGRYLGIAMLAALAAGLGAFLGHLYPVWLGFKGGKGVATYLGVALGYASPLGAIFAATWLAVATLSRYSSLAALTACAAVPIAALMVPDVWFVAPREAAAVLLAAMSMLVFIRHRQNITRLRNGTEPRIGSDPPTRPTATEPHDQDPPVARS